MDPQIDASQLLIAAKLDAAHGRNYDNFGELERTQTRSGKDQEVASIEKAKTAEPHG